MKKSIKQIYIVGPTASGKTDLALTLAKKYHGQIICADSRTIYKGLDLGTAKPSQEEQKSIKHYGLDLIYPNEKFSAADFQRLAVGWIEEIQKQGKLPIIVGGTGLYIDGIVYDYKFGEKADLSLRSLLNEKSIFELQEIIKKEGYIMPENLNNKRHLIRAIEQKGINKNRSKISPDSLIVGLNLDKKILDQRIKKRGLAMIDNGVLKEIEKLASDYGFAVPGATGNIYQAFQDYFVKDQTLEVSLDKFESLDRKLAKRQMTWFKRNKDIVWFTSKNKALKYISSIM